VPVTSTLDVMNALSPPSKLERVAGNPAIEMALTAAGAVAGGVLAPLLPVLAKSLAASRQEQRINAALAEISAVLDEHHKALEQLSDPQYKLLNEVILSVLHTTENEKLAYLKRALKRTLYASELKAHEAIVLSRMVRDISADEAAFLLRTFQFERIIVTEELNLEVNANGIRVHRASAEGLCATGLVSLGILAPTEDFWGGATAFSFSPITAKLIALLRPDDV